jgi:PGF-CTERM protein
MQLRSLAVALVAALLVVGAGTGGALAATDSRHAQQSPTNTTTGGAETTTSGTATETSGPSVTFNDQNSSGESVLVRSATLPEDGFVAIYDSSRPGNETNQVIGVSYPLSAGTSDNIRIQLNQSLNQTKSLTAVVHTDSNNNSQFDFVASNGQQDPPLTQGDRRIVDIAMVSVQNTGTADGGVETTTTEGSDTTDASEATDTDAATDAGGAGGTEANASGNETGGTNGSGGNGSSSSGPGFGLAVAVVALLAAALLATRRN